MKIMIFWLRWVMRIPIRIFFDCESEFAAPSQKNLLNHFQLSIVILLMILKKIFLSEIRLKDKKYQDKKKTNKE